MVDPTTVRMMGVPSDLGAGRRGVDMGPSAIRYAHLADALEDLGVDCQDQGNVDVPLPERSETRQSTLRQSASVLNVASRVRASVAETLTSGRMPLVLGGDHSLSIGTLAGVCATRANPGVLWVDAHGDFNTPETTPSGNIHGMSLALGCGRGAPELLEIFPDGRFLDPSRVAIIGARTLDPEERDLLKTSGVAVFTMSEIDRRGLRQVLDDALRQVTSGTDSVHVSFDMDVLDPSVAPGVGTPVGGGLSYREAHLLMETVAEFGALGSLEMVEVNPILDHSNQTGQLAVELIASALGRRIF
ncbi:MAG: arginase [Candidatus Bipolaricaulia bacterium]